MKNLLSWKNIVFNFLLLSGVVYLELHQHIFDFFLDDASYISLVLLGLYPLAIIRYSFSRVKDDWWLGRVTNLYRHLAPLMGAIGTVIGMYVIFKGLAVMEVSADNLQAILKTVTNGIFIDLVPTATGLFISGLIAINRFLFGDQIESV